MGKMTHTETRKDKKNQQLDVKTCIGCAMQSIDFQELKLDQMKMEGVIEIGQG